MSLASSAAGHRTVKHLLLLAVKWVIVGAKHLCFYSLVNTLAGLLTITTHNQDGQHMHVQNMHQKVTQKLDYEFIYLIPTCFYMSNEHAGPQFSVTIITVARQDAGASWGLRRQI